MLDIWEMVLTIFAEKEVPAILNVFGDNQATLHVCARGRSVNLRHLNRTHRVNLSFLYDIALLSPSIYLQYVQTGNQAADILTKGKFTTSQWKKLTKLVSIGPMTAVDTIATTTHRE